MANYLEMNREELAAEKAKLNEQYKKFLAMNLKLNMARGKPGPHQMDLAMGLLQMTDYTTDAGTDARNYGDLEGLHEARVLFSDVFGVKPEELALFHLRPGAGRLREAEHIANVDEVYISCRLELPPTNTSSGLTPNTSANRTRASCRPSRSP